MDKRLLSFLIFVVVGALAIVGYYFARPFLEAKKQLSSSDAGDAQDSLVIGVDNWVGYFPLCSREMRKRMRSAGYAFRCLDDKANYSQRMNSLKEGSIDFAVATVDSFMLNAAPVGFPGSIVMVIDESKGGDAIVAQEERIKSLEDIKEKKDVKIAYTPSSPSEHLLKSVAVHFDIPALRSRSGKWRVPTDGSEAALKKLLSGKVEVAVLWEPDVSRAIASDKIKKLLGTEDTSKLVVDILVAGRGTLLEKPELVKVVIANYFRALKVYRDQPSRLEEELREETKLSNEQVKVMLKGVRWQTLHENATRWFGVRNQGLLGDEGLIDTIESTADILVDAGDFSSTPIPNGDPYRLQNKKFVELLFEKGLSGQFAKKGSKPKSETDSASSLTQKFNVLSAQAWNNLREIGTLKIRPITFQSGTSALNHAGKKELDKAVSNLTHYPNFRVVIKGHSGLRGDAEANRVLSQERAEAVARYLKVTYGIDGNRLREIGYGSNEPLPRKPGESERRYNYRLPRVELFLVSEEY